MKTCCVVFSFVFQFPFCYLNADVGFFLSNVTYVTCNNITVVAFVFLFYVTSIIVTKLSKTQTIYTPSFS